MRQGAESEPNGSASGCGRAQRADPTGDTLCAAVLKALAEFATLARTLGPALLGGIVGVGAVGFAGGILWRADAIREALHASGHTLAAAILEPAALAVLVSALTVTGVAARSWVSGLSPRGRLRRMADDVSDLAAALTDRERYYYDLDEIYGAPLPSLEAQIAIVKARLARLDIRSPEVSDGAAWRAYIPLLSAWVATGDLPAARAHRL